MVGARGAASRVNGLWQTPVSEEHLLCLRAAATESKKRKPEAPPAAQASAELLASNASFATSDLEDLLPSEGFEVVAPPADPNKKKECPERG